eukprot:3859936-Pleurochrysis_carterae.AAC.4
MVAQSFCQRTTRVLVACKAHAWGCLHTPARAAQPSLTSSALEGVAGQLNPFCHEFLRTLK